MAIVIFLVKRGRAINDEDAYQSSSQLAYFNILEAGMVIIAVNLPSLWYYINNVTPKSVLRSVRSVLSLRSQRTTSHHSTQPSSMAISERLSKPRPSGVTTSSSLDLVGGDRSKGEVEMFTLGDLEADSGRGEGLEWRGL
ncbi:hypothetical protein MMC15_004287 [Xylographa vitiligo]|nr:hypothetical protein [Xylographa vitiligo]